MDINFNLEYATVGACIARPRNFIQYELVHRYGGVIPLIGEMSRSDKGVMAKP